MWSKKLAVDCEHFDNKTKHWTAAIGAPQTREAIAGGLARGRRASFARNRASLRSNNNRDVLIRGQRPIVRAATEDISAGLVENHLPRNLSIGWNGVRRPDRRPRRICSGPSVFPRIDLRRIERYFTGAAINKPGNMQSQILADGNSCRGSRRQPG